MKKHFLLLFLMALLPLAGWADAEPATLRTVPATVSGLYYNGDFQAITSPLTGANYQSDYQINHGGVKFVIKATQADPTDDEKAAALILTESSFTAKNAGYNYIYYQVLGDGGNYTDGVWTYLGAVYINKAITSYSTQIEGATDLVYNPDATSYSLVATAPVPTYGTVLYKVGEGEYSEDLPTATSVGTYTVYYKVEEGENFEAIAEAQIDVTVAKATATIEAPTAIENLVYNNAAQQLIQAGSITTGDGELQYSLDGTTWNNDAASIKATNANEEGYSVYYKMTEGTNYAATEPATISVSIAKLNINDAKVGVKNIDDETFTGSQITPKSGTQPILYYEAPSNVIKAENFTRSWGENINVGEGTIVLTPIADKNLTGDPRTATFQIVAADIANVTIEAIDDQTYTANPITPAVTVKLGEYTLVEKDGFEVAITNNTNVGPAVVTVTPKAQGSNFSGENKVANFNIVKANLTVTADSKEKFFGDADPERTYTLSGFLGTDNKDNINLTGAPVIGRPDTEEVGVHTYTVNVNNLTADNYSFEAATAENQGALTIKASTVIITPDAIDAQTYGYKLPDDLDVKEAFAFSVSGLRAGASITALKFKVTNADNEEQTAGTMLDAGEYTITPYDATCDAAGYTLTYATTTLTIDKKAIKVVAMPQTVAYGGEAVLDKNYPVANPTTWTNTYVELQNTDGTTIGKAAFTGLYGLWKEDFVANLSWDAEEGYDDKPIAHPGFIVANPADYDTDNWDVTFEKGAVTYSGVPTEVTFKGDADDLTKINTYAGQKMIVKMNFATRNDRSLGTAREWKAGYWHTMVLPFNISVADLSKTLGYAIVNVIDPSKTVVSGTGSEFYGKLTMKGGYGNEEKIPANKPFILKLAYDIDPTKDYNFGQQTIVAPANEADRTVDAGGDCSFVGTYETKTVTSADKAAYWFMLGNYEKWAYIMESSTNTWDIIPFEAYIDMSNLPAGARNMTFYVEEIDGSTTAIKSINVDDINQKLSPEGWYNLNGVKQQGAPTQKGIYIKDGKKFMIK